MSVQQNRVGRPLVSLLFPFRPLYRGLMFLARWLAAFIGRLGLACRHLLTIFIWKPFLFVTRPLRWLYSRLLHKPLAWLLRPCRALLKGFWLLAGWLGLVLRRQLGRLLRPLRVVLERWWEARAAWRRRWWRRRHSRWLIIRARVQLALRWRRPPAEAALAPAVSTRSGRVPQMGNYVTVLVTVNVILVGLSLVVQQRQPVYQREPAAISIAATPTSPPPTATPAPTQTPIVIELTPTVAWPTPDPLSEGGSVAFTRRHDGQSDIYALVVGQAAPVRLTNDSAEDRDPAWSPDGRQLAFSSRRDGNWELYILDLPSGTVQRLTSHPGLDAAPSWSPDGQWLVYEAYREDNLDLYIVKADGSQGPIRLTEHPAPDFAPVWSPGGRHIAFTSRRTGNKDIFILSLDAATDEAPTNVTASPAADEDQPAFHPQGDYIAFHDDSTGFALVYAIPLKNERPSGDRLSLGQGSDPAWSPDGEELVYVHQSNGQDYLIASAIDAWRVAPQAFASTERLGDPSWTAVALPRQLSEPLQTIARTTGTELFTEQRSPQASGPTYLLQPVPVDAPASFLNDQVDNSFIALRTAVIQAAGWDFLGTLDHMFEPLDTRPLPGQSDHNWNKAGRAFDVDYRHVLAFEPQVEVIREDHGNETYWRIYLRATVQDGSQGEPLRELPWDFRARYGADPRYYDEGGKLKEELPAGYYIDFTALAADYGWDRVPADTNWRTYFAGVQFWHYENRGGLSWDEAMLELYSPEEMLERFGDR